MSASKQATILCGDKRTNFGVFKIATIPRDRLDGLVWRIGIALDWFCLEPEEFDIAEWGGGDFYDHYTVWLNFASPGCKSEVCRMLDVLLGDSEVTWLDGHENLIAYAFDVPLEAAKVLSKMAFHSKTPA